MNVLEKLKYKSAAWRKTISHDMKALLVEFEVT